MTLETIGSAIGAGLGAAGIVVVSARRWLSQRAEKKIDAVAQELGVGVGPTIASLVMSTASAVQRLDAHMGGSSERIESLVRVQGEHAAKLLEHEGRIVIIESRHETCAFNSEQVACLLAQKTERVAEKLAEKTEHVAEVLAAKTVQTARKLRGSRKVA